MYVLVQLAAVSHVSQKKLHRAPVGTSNADFAGRASGAVSQKRGNQMKNQDTIRTLNELIRVVHDGERGFAKCARHARSARLSRLFESRAGECAEFRAELSRLLQELGGVPDEGRSVSSALYRRWVDLRVALNREDDAAVLEEGERGEDYALEAYRNALDEHLPETVRSLLLRQFERTMANHERIRRLRSLLSQRAPATATEVQH